MTRPRPEQRQPGETYDGYRWRTRHWRAMRQAAAEAKTVRSRLRSVLIALTTQHRYRGELPTPIPESQASRVAVWIEVLSRVDAQLEVLDLEAWEPELRAELLPATPKDRL